MPELPYVLMEPLAWLGILALVGTGIGIMAEIIRMVRRP